MKGRCIVTSRRRVQLLAEIQRAGANGRIFTLEFRRRRDKIDPSTGQVLIPAGSPRVMFCRLHVSKGVKGVQPDRHDQDNKNAVITVFEMAGDRSGFKCVPLDGITAVG